MTRFGTPCRVPTYKSDGTRTRGLRRDRRGPICRGRSVVSNICHRAAFACESGSRQRAGRSRVSGRWCGGGVGGAEGPRTPLPGGVPRRGGAPPPPAARRGFTERPFTPAFFEPAPAVKLFAGAVGGGRAP